MGKLVLVRHGESRWNMHNRFTGWVDVPLSENGLREAERCAVHCEKYNFSTVFTSALERTHVTAAVILSRQGRNGIIQHDEKHRYRKWMLHSNTCGKGDIPIYESPVLNERFYGDLQGMEKKQAEKVYGKQQVFAWRRGFSDKPPGGESMKQTFMRIHPYFDANIMPRVAKSETVLLSGHGNTLRAIIRHIEGISNEDIVNIDLPEATPIVYEYRRGKFIRIAGEYRLNRPLR
jgi:2,3-bisphosphoglycerate-dependent phosphoglycerate mutase